ncbi:GDSL-type esterase/lipase family protein [Chengkuizengella sp. SCS-71B]|uniref:GDSL-type esterase/lipase family protein n=1 Tax=Chengkuizengella sp. SCS-71B TaxID=3115290 RepID=UPI0032C22206
MRKNKLYIMLMIVCFLLANVSIPQTHAELNTLNYVALGDSIAAGYTPEGEIDEGYSDFIEEYLDENAPLITYTKQFAIPGLTTSDLNGLIQNNLSTEQFLSLFGGGFPSPLVGEITENISIENLTVQDAIIDADVITLTIGANDILSEIPYDAVTGTIEMSGIDIDQITRKMGEVEENLSSVLEQIFALNGEVQVYVSGYFFPYPHLIDQMPQAQLDILLDTLDSLNSIIIDATNDHNDAFYVSLESVFPNDPTEYLPNEQIHPTIEGYELIADRFMEVMEEQASGLPELPEPEETPLTLNYVALGDSIAAGFTPTRTIDKGYTDFIEEYLDENEPLITYTKQFAIPGLTTSDLNGLIENDLSTEQFLSLFGGGFPVPLVEEITENISIENLTVQDAIIDADVITLTIGANDILSEIPYDTNNNIVNMSEMNIDQLMTNMEKAKENLSGVLEQIFELNDEVQVYVSGYFFPYPHLSDQSQVQPLMETLNTFNTKIKTAAEDNNAFYVSLEGVFSNGLYLLPGEIHPTEVGYQLIAERFIDVMEQQAEDSQEKNEPEETTESRNTSSTNLNRGNETDNETEVSDPEVVEPELDPETTEKTTQQKFETLKTIGIFNGYEDGMPHLEDVMTREQAAKIITLLLGLNIEDADSLDESQYSDVEQERWSYKYIAAATKAGIMNGVGDNKFDSTGNVTMEQFIKIMVEGYAFVSGIEIAENENLELENVSGWAKKYVVAAIQLGLMEEQADYTLPASRALLVEGAYTIYQSLYEE